MTAGLALTIAAPPAVAANSGDGIGAVEAQVIAEQQAESHVSSVKVSQSTAAPDRLVEAAPIYEVTLQGHFVYNGAGIPPGHTAPEGNVMEVAVNRETDAIESIKIPAAPTATAASVRRRSPRARAATWSGGHCKYVVPFHCYAVANWVMTGSEKAEGVVAEVDTENMNIPEWMSDATVTNEVWANFEPAEHWVEIGTIAGRGRDCCSLSWFYAWESGAGFEIKSELGPITPNTWPVYWMQAVGGGTWCWKIGEHGEATVACQGGFSTYSNRLIDGMEVASESEPTNSGKVVTSYQALNGEWRLWNKAKKEHAERTCVSEFQPHPGNINYGTC